MIAGNRWSAGRGRTRNGVAQRKAAREEESAQGASEDGREKPKPKKESGYAAYRKKTAAAAGRQRARAGSEVPEWKLLRWMNHYFRPDPGEAKRSDKFNNAEYEPVPLVIHLQDDPNNPGQKVPGVLMQRAWPLRRGEEGRKGPVWSISHNGTLPNEDEPYPDLLDLAYSQADEHDQSRFISRDVTVFRATLYDFYHEEIVKKGTAEYHNFHRCDGVDENDETLCYHCEEGIPRKAGRDVFFELNPAQTDALIDGVLDGAVRCLSCGEGEVFTDHLSCIHCDKIVLDSNSGIEEDDVLTDELEVQCRDQEVQCPHCDEWGVLKVVRKCSVQRGYEHNAKWTDGCDNPQVIDNPWESMITVRAVESGRSSILEVVDVKPLAKDWRANLELSPDSDSFTVERFYAPNIRDQYMRLKEWLGPERGLPMSLKETQALVDSMRKKHFAKLEKAAVDSGNEGAADDADYVAKD